MISHANPLELQCAPVHSDYSLFVILYDQLNSQTFVPSTFGGIMHKRQVAI